MRLNYLYISKSLVGADAYISPAEYTIFTVIFGEFATAQRADVGIGPYRICSNMSVRSANPWTYFPP